MRTLLLYEIFNDKDVLHDSVPAEYLNHGHLVEC